MNKKYLLALLPIVFAPQLNAEIVFNFQQVGDDVVMTSSGSIDVSGLVYNGITGWGGTGTQNSDTDLLGGNSGNTINAGYKFNAGTDYSAWTTANPFNASYFIYTVVGTKSFTTHSGASDMLVGLGINSADLVGSIWTPDQIWTAHNKTLAAVGLNVGTYTVTDAVSGQSITILIGISAVPEPSTYATLAGAGVFLIVLLRRKVRSQ